MHIGLFVKDFAVGKKFSKDGLPTKSGAEFHAENHAKQLIKRGNEVTIFAKKRYHFTKARENIDGIDLVRLHAPVRWLEIIVRLLTTHSKIDAFYIIGTPKFAVWAIFMARFLKLPTTLVLTGTFEVFDRNKNWRNKVFSRCSNYIAISNEIKRGIIKRVGISEGLISVLPQGVDSERFSPVTYEEKCAIKMKYKIPISAPVVVFCARLVLRKGTDLVMKFWPKVHDRFPDAILCIVGGGENDIVDNMRNMGRLSGNSVFFAGEVDNPTEFYCMSDVYVLPSRAEGLPTTLMEAMSCGLPAVVSDIGGCEDLVENGVSGYRIQTENVDEYVDKITELLGNERKRNDMGKMRYHLFEKIAIM